MYKDYYYLGKITKLFSFKGEVVVFFDVDDISEYRGLDALYIDFNGDLVPYLIENISFGNSNSATVRLQDIDSEYAARRLVNCALYLPLSTLPKLTGKKFYYHEVIGFEVQDQKEGRVGIVESINDSAAQALFEIRDGFTEILLPIIDDFIIEIDRTNKIIKVVFPEGLLDIYRNKEED
jgi:16S rRNA processing protein RimM